MTASVPAGRLARLRTSGPTMMRGTVAAMAVSVVQHTERVEEQVDLHEASMAEPTGWTAPTPGGRGQLMGARRDAHGGWHARRNRARTGRLRPIGRPCSRGEILGGKQNDMFWEAMCLRRRRSQRLDGAAASA